MANLAIEDSLLREPNLWIPNKRPVGPVKIDWEHPLTEGLLVAFVPPSSRWDLTRKQAGNQYYNPAYATRIIADYLYVSGEDGSGLQFPISPLAGASAFTASILVRRLSAEQTDFMGNWADPDHVLIRTASPDAQCFIFTTIQTGGAFANLTLDLFELATFTFTYDGSSLHGYKNGVESPTSFSPSGVLSNGVDFTLGNSVYNSSNETEVHNSFIFNRALSSAEISDWYEDTYQILVPA